MPASDDVCVPAVASGKGEGGDRIIGVVYIAGRNSLAARVEQIVKNRTGKYKWFL